MATRTRVDAEAEIEKLKKVLKGRAEGIGRWEKEVEELRKSRELLGNGEAYGTDREMRQKLDGQLGSAEKELKNCCQMMEEEACSLLCLSGFGGRPKKDDVQFLGNLLSECPRSKTLRHYFLRLAGVYPKEGLAACDCLLKREPKNADFALLKAQVAEAYTIAESCGPAKREYLLEESLGKVWQLYDNAVELDGMSEKARLLRAHMIFLLLGKPEKAIKEYEEVLTLNPNNAEALCALGDIHYLRMGDSKKAEGCYSKLSGLRTELMFHERVREVVDSLGAEYQVVPDPIASPQKPKDTPLLPEMLKAAGEEEKRAFDAEIVKAQKKLNPPTPRSPSEPKKCWPHKPRHELTPEEKAEEAQAIDEQLKEFGKGVPLLEKAVPDWSASGTNTKFAMDAMCKESVAKIKEDAGKEPPEFNVPELGTIPQQIAYGRALTECIEGGVLGKLLTKPQIDILKATAGERVWFTADLVDRVAGMNGMDTKTLVMEHLRPLESAGLVKEAASSSMLSGGHTGESEREWEFRRYIIGRTACINLEGVRAQLESYNEGIPWGYRQMDLERLYYEDGREEFRYEMDYDPGRPNAEWYSHEVAKLNFLLENGLVRIVEDDRQTRAVFELTELGKYYMQHMSSCKIPHAALAKRAAFLKNRAEYDGKLNYVLRRNHNPDITRQCRALLICSRAASDPELKGECVWRFVNNLFTTEEEINELLRLEKSEAMRKAISKYLETEGGNAKAAAMEFMRYCGREFPELAEFREEMDCFKMIMSIARVYRKGSTADEDKEEPKRDIIRLRKDEFAIPDLREWERAAQRLLGDAAGVFMEILNRHEKEVAEFGPRERILRAAISLVAARLEEAGVERRHARGNGKIAIDEEIASLEKMEDLELDELKGLANYYGRRAESAFSETKDYDRALGFYDLAAALDPEFFIMGTGIVWALEKARFLAEMAVDGKTDAEKALSFLGEVEKETTSKRVWETRLEIMRLYAERKIRGWNDVLALYKQMAEKNMGSAWMRVRKAHDLVHVFKMADRETLGLCFEVCEEDFRERKRNYEINKRREFAGPVDKHTERLDDAVFVFSKVYGGVPASVKNAAAIDERYMEMRFAAAVPALEKYGSAVKLSKSTDEDAREAMGNLLAAKAADFEEKHKDVWLALEKEEKRLKKLAEQRVLGQVSPSSA